MENTENKAHYNKSYSYFLTMFDINDFLNEDDTVNNAKMHHILVNRLNAVYYCYNLEYAPTTGRKHLHLVLCFFRPVEFTRIKQYLNNPNVQTRNGTIEDCAVYLKKENPETFVEYGVKPAEKKHDNSYSLAIAELTHEVKELQSDISGLRSTINELKNMIYDMQR
jgi:hypothetical protein